MHEQSWQATSGLMVWALLQLTDEQLM